MDAPEITANPFAALLDGVPRRVIEDGGDALYHGKRTTHLPETEVLATLAAAYPADLAEAGTVLEGAVWVTFNCAPNAGRQPAIVTRDDPGFLPDRFEAARYVPADTITALLARIAAQEAQIGRLEGKSATLTEYAAAVEKSAETAETALAAERAKVAKLVEALEFYADETAWREGPVETVDTVIGTAYRNKAAEIRIDRGKRARAAITEATQ